MSKDADRARAYLVFSEALDLDPQARRAFLAEHCGSDAALRAEVDALLAAASADPLVTGSLLAPPPPAPELLSGQIVGRFRLAERLGEGGMGVVYRALRTDEVQQEVAIKLMSSLVTASSQRAFEREAQILARLEHPAIARLIDAGVQDSRPWIAIEFVRGERIDEFCSARHPPIRAIVQLLAQIAEAVCAAHRLLIVHSDIKPTNVLVTPAGAPRLIDFGISTALRETGGEAAATVNTARLFSPGYAAPEQVSGDPITVATDVFGLGALAYRLLTGAPPHAPPAGASARASSDSLGYLVAVTQRDIAPASETARARGRSAAWVGALRGDVDAILGRALERDPARRYASASDLLADLQRYLEERPVEARVPSAGYRLGKFLRRNTAASALGTVAILGAAVATVALVWQAHLLALQRDVARLAAARAQRSNDFLVSMLQAADPELGGRRDVTVAELLDAGAAQTRTSLADDPRVRAQMLTTIAQTDYQLGRYQAGLAAANAAVALLLADAGAQRELAQALHVKGKLLNDSGDRAAAMIALRSAIERFASLPGTDRERAVTMKDLGMAMFRTSDPRSAERWYRDAIEIFRRLGIDDADHGDTLVSLGELLQLDGRFSESLRLEREGQAMMLRHESPDNPDVLGAGIAIAEALQSLGRYPEAEAMHRQLIADRERVLGPKHADTLTSKLSLSANLRMQRRYAEAIDMARPAADELASVMGANHPTRMFALSMLGLAECEGGEPQAGLASVQQASDIRTARFGAADRRASLGRVLVAACLLRLGRSTEANAILARETAWRSLATGSYSDLRVILQPAPGARSVPDG